MLSIAVDVDEDDEEDNKEVSKTGGHLINLSASFSVMLTG